MKQLIYILGLGFLFLFCACEEELAEEERVVEVGETAIEKAKGVEMFYSDSAIVRFKIEAELMYDYLAKEEKKREFPNGVKVEFYDENFNVSSYLVAQYALHFKDKNQIVLQDSIVVWNSKGEKFYTDELVWNEKTETVTSDKEVIVITKEGTLKGNSFISNQDFSKWEMRKGKGFFYNELGIE